MPIFFYTGTLPPGLAGGGGGGIEGPPAPNPGRIALFEADGDLQESALEIEGETIVTSTGTLTLPAGTATIAKTTDIPAAGIGGSTGAVDNALLRADGAGGATAQSSPVVASDAGEVSGVTRLDVDNLSLDGNTLRALDANGPVIIAPNGSGSIGLFGGTSSEPGFKRRAGTSQVQLSNGDGTAAGIAWAERLYIHDTIDNFGAVRVLLHGGGAVPAVQLAGVSTVAWSSSASDGGQAKDLELGRAAASVLRVGDGGAGIAAVLAGRVVEASTAGVGAPNLLAATESRKLLTNEGATAEAYNTLPTGAPIGCEFQAYCADADGIRITAPAGETIRNGPAVSSAAGFIRSVVIGSGITLEKVSASGWAAVNAPNGTWTIDT